MKFLILFCLSAVLVCVYADANKAQCDCQPCCKRKEIVYKDDYQPKIEVVYQGQACECQKALPYRVERPVVEKEKLCQHKYNIECKEEKIVPHKRFLYNAKVERPIIVKDPKLNSYPVTVEKLITKTKCGPRYVYNTKVEAPKPCVETKLVGLTAKVDKIVLPIKDCLQPREYPEPKSCEVCMKSSGECGCNKKIYRKVDGCKKCHECSGESGCGCAKAYYSSEEGCSVEDCKKIRYNSDEVDCGCRRCKKIVRTCDSSEETCGCGKPKESCGCRTPQYSSEEGCGRSYETKEYSSEESCGCRKRKPCHTYVSSEERGCGHYSSEESCGCRKSKHCKTCQSAEEIYSSEETCGCGKPKPCKTCQSSEETNCGCGQYPCISKCKKVQYSSEETCGCKTPKCSCEEVHVCGKPACSAHKPNTWHYATHYTSSAEDCRKPTCASKERDIVCYKKAHTSPIYSEEIGCGCKVPKCVVEDCGCKKVEESSEEVICTKHISAKPCGCNKCQTKPACDEYDYPKTERVYVKTRQYYRYDPKLNYNNNKRLDFHENQSLLTYNNNKPINIKFNNEKLSNNPINIAFNNNKQSNQDCNNVWRYKRHLTPIETDLKLINSNKHKRNANSNNLKQSFTIKSTSTNKITREKRQKNSKTVVNCHLLRPKREYFMNNLQDYSKVTEPRTKYQQNMLLIKLRELKHQNQTDSESFKRKLGKRRRLRKKLNEEIREKRSVNYKNYKIRKFVCPTCEKLRRKQKYTNDQLALAGCSQYIPEILTKFNSKSTSTSSKSNSNYKPIKYGPKYCNCLHEFTQRETNKFKSPKKLNSKNNLYESKYKQYSKLNKPKTTKSKHYLNNLTFKSNKPTSYKHNSISSQKKNNHVESKYTYKAPKSSKLNYYEHNPKTCKTKNCLICPTILKLRKSNKYNNDLCDQAGISQYLPEINSQTIYKSKKPRIQSQNRDYWTEFNSGIRKKRHSTNFDGNKDFPVKVVDVTSKHVRPHRNRHYSKLKYEIAPQSSESEKAPNKGLYYKYLSLTVPESKNIDNSSENGENQSHESEDVISEAETLEKRVTDSEKENVSVVADKDQICTCGCGLTNCNCQSCSSKTFNCPNYQKTRSKFTNCNSEGLKISNNSNLDHKHAQKPIELSNSDEDIEKKAQNTQSNNNYSKLSKTPTENHRKHRNSHSNHKQTHRHHKTIPYNPHHSPKHSKRPHHYPVHSKPHRYHSKSPYAGYYGISEPKIKYPKTNKANHDDYDYYSNFYHAYNSEEEDQSEETPKIQASKIVYDHLGHKYIENHGYRKLIKPSFDFWDGVEKFEKSGHPWMCHQDVIEPEDFENYHLNNFQDAIPSKFKKDDRTLVNSEEQTFKPESEMVEDVPEVTTVCLKDDLSSEGSLFVVNEQNHGINNAEMKTSTKSTQKHEVTTTTCAETSCKLETTQVVETTTLPSKNSMKKQFSKADFYKKLVEYTLEKAELDEKYSKQHLHTKDLPLTDLKSSQSYKNCDSYIKFLTTKITPKSQHIELSNEFKDAIDAILDNDNLTSHIDNFFQFKTDFEKHFTETQKLNTEHVYKSMLENLFSSADILQNYKNYLVFKNEFDNLKTKLDLKEFNIFDFYTYIDSVLYIDKSSQSTTKVQV